MRQTGLRHVLLALALSVSSRAVDAQTDSARARPDSSVLSGVVRDSAGRPLVEVEVLIDGGNASTRSSEGGGFSITAPPGSHDVWFRRIGMETVRYLWVARSAERTAVEVTMRALPHTLDPVVVKATEERRLRGTASIRGRVVDDAGAPVEDVEVQVIGANVTGITKADGNFLFRRLPRGAVVLRVRKLGYTPNMVASQLSDADEREIVVRLHRLPATLDPVVVMARSGYDESESVWEDFERRRRWQVTQGVVLGPADLQRYGKMALDLAARSIMNGADELSRMRGASRTVTIGYGDHADNRGAVPGSVCILENGSRALYRPLSTYSASDLKLLEIYPSRSELSGTVAVRMEGLRECRRGENFEHPTYYVLWLR